MIVYFADRKMQVLGNASTGLPKGFAALQDKKIEDIESGVASFECVITFSAEDRLQLQQVVKAGNYLLRKNGGENEFYTIIESELNVDAQEIYIYAEDAGLDLLNNIAMEFEATDAHPIAWYVNKWIAGSGFEIGVNEIPDLSRKLKWEGETTVTERLASVATQFDNAEISYSFDIDRLQVLHRYVNIYKSRGKDVGEQFRINKNLNNIIIKSSVGNLATALYVTGGTPEGKEEPITLSGYKYDDGDFYVDGKYLRSRKALAKWGRYLPETGGSGSHLEKTYSYDTTSQSELCKHALTELKKICDTEVNYEVDIAELPASVKIGDRIDLVDDKGEIYLSARILALEISIADKTQKATLGEYLIKTSGIDAKVEALAAQFAEIAKSRVYYTWVVYADDENGNGITLDPTGKAYMGISANRTGEDPDLTDPSVYRWSKVEGNTGKSLAGIIEHYLVSDQTEGITIDSEAWSTAIPIMTAKNKYLWNYETLVYSDGSRENLAPKVIGAYGDPGEPAAEIVTMTEQYYLSTSDTELADGEWVRTMPVWEPGKYLWTRWCIEWSEPNPELLTYSEPCVAKSYNDIHEAANNAAIAADEAKTQASSAMTQVTEVNKEIVQANQEIDALAQNLETVKSEMTQNYATKGELTEVNTNLGTQISQNAAQISQTATKVQEIDIDASKALEDAATAQQAANTAQSAANKAQADYVLLQQQADVTDEQLTAAKEAVEKAQADATAAGDAAAAAQSAANSLTDRVITAESNITQNAEMISQTVSRVDNLKFGGRNLLKHTKVLPITETARGDDGVSLYNANGTLEDTDDGVKLMFGSVSSLGMCIPLVSDGCIDNGDELTLSLKYRGNITNPGSLFLLQRETPNVSYNLAANTELTANETEWQEFKATFAIPNANERICYSLLIFYGLSAYTTDNWVEVKGASLKLEKGNLATDWSPAHEEVSEEARDYISGEITSEQSKIESAFNGIVLDYLKDYTKISELNEFKETIENTFKIDEKGFSFDFVQRKLESLDGKIGAINDQVVTQNGFIRLVTNKDGTNPKIVIGENTSPFMSVFTKDALLFTSGWNEEDSTLEETTIARYTNDGLETQNMYARNQVKISTNWAIRSGENIAGKGSNLDIVWIGG